MTSGFDIPWLSESAIRKRAAAFLAEAHPAGDIPVPIESIVERAGVDIVPIPGLHTNYDVDGFTSGDGQTIYVDARVSEEVETRYRFTLAHEMGHIILHQSLLNQTRTQFSSLAAWVEFLRHIPEPLRGRAEWQAYAFAGLILVPTNYLIAEHSNVLPQIKELLTQAVAQGASIAEAKGFAWDELAARLAGPFLVSRDVVLKRLQSEGLTADGFGTP
ncbi:MAG: ImmA/IrrE family metallo-endopeptidase [Planctomycetes bacterium]|nr:ImmA/IrrE family metallo-endopeptidase [Planctomycetota bacterium]